MPINVDKITNALKEASLYIGMKVYHYSETYCKIIAYKICDIKAAAYPDDYIEVWFECRYDEEFAMTEDSKTKEYSPFYTQEKFSFDADEINESIFLTFEDCYADTLDKYQDFCRHCINEICTNDKCPYCADYCPIAEHQELCKHYEDIVFLDRKVDKDNV